jgi:hypothetical protein
MTDGDCLIGGWRFLPDDDDSGKERTYLIDAAMGLWLHRPIHLSLPSFSSFFLSLLTFIPQVSSLFTEANHDHASVCLALCRRCCILYSNYCSLCLFEHSQLYYSHVNVELSVGSCLTRSILTVLCYYNITSLAVCIPTPIPIPYSTFFVSMVSTLHLPKAVNIYFTQQTKI